MNGKFKLEIELGNAAMQTRRQVAGALRRLAEEIDRNKDKGSILDLNGNTVGTWSFEKEDE